MPSIRVHSIEGSQVSVKSGIEKLVKIKRSTDIETDLFVLSPSKSQELALDRLAERAIKRDEKFWGRLEKSQDSWRELAENVLLDKGENDVREEITRAFGEIETVLNALWIMGEGSDAALRHLGGITSNLLAIILRAKFSEEGYDALIISSKEILKAPPSWRRQSLFHL